MRVWVALVLLLFFGSASAQVLTDPVGDVQAQAGGQGAPVSQATAIDLAALNVTETPDAFRFTVKVADLGGDQARPDAGTISILFAYDNVTYRADYYRSFDNAAYFGSLYSSKDGANFHYLHDTTVARDLASATVWSDIARQDIVGASGKIPGRGDHLESIRVHAAAQPVDIVGVDLPANATVSDSMPDVGGPLGTWQVLYHGEDGVGASLTSPHPFRSSNGEATTYPFEVTALQSGDKAGRFTLEATNLPADWNVSLPGNLLDLAPSSPVTFTVHVKVPFNHVHGAAKSLTLRLQQTNGPAWASLELGVHYTSTPQPAGHHPTLYLHSEDWSKTAELVNPPLGGSTGAMTMNTLADDLADTRNGVEGYSNIGGTTARWTWDVCLQPQLAIGIDMNLTASGSFSVPVTTTRPLTAATLTGRLILLGPGNSGPWCFDWSNRKQTPLADFAGTPQDLAPNTPVILTGAVKANPAGDYVPYQDGAEMVLEIVLTSSQPGIGGADGPFIEPGAMLTLPINEYHEAGTSSFLQTATNGPAPAFITSTAPRPSPAAAPLLVCALVLAALAATRRRN